MTRRSRFVISFAFAIGVASTQAHAGFWDSVTGFFGGSDKEQEQSAARESTPESSAGELMQTGLELLPMLTQSLGVTGAQAEGGMGAILQAAQSLLSGSDWSTLASAIPNLDSLLAAAPAFTGGDTGSMLDSAMSAAGDYSETAKTGQQLLGQFKQLGLSADMIPQFTGVASDYLEQTDNEEAGDLLSSAMNGLL